MIVADVMTRDVETLRPDATLKEAARAMVEAGVSGMPIVDDQGAVVGIITEADFVAPHHKHRRSRRLLHALFGNDENLLAEARDVSELMTEDVITVKPDQPVKAAARLMTKEKVKRLPVIDDRRRLVGIVSRADVMRSFARSDDEVAADAHASIASVPLPLDLSQIHITVDDGVVTIKGRVEASADAVVVEHVVERIEGVLRVENRLDYEVDLSRPEQRWPGYDQEGAES